MRPQQWTKNILIYSALLFSGNLFKAHKFISVSLVFVAFCLTSSGIYFINDIFDIDKDKADPKKSNRPVASGKIKLRSGSFIAIILMISGLILSLAVDFKCALIILSYVLINLLYTIKLKHVVIMDVMIIAYGFVARAVTGAFAADVRMTAWFLLCVMFISLFLALGKRRNELIEVHAGVIQKGRSVLKYYTTEFIDQLMTIVTASMIMCYALFTMDAGTENNLAMSFTIPLVLYGLFYYLYVVRVKNGGGSPDEALYKEKPILFTVGLYVIFVMVIRNF